MHNLVNCMKLIKFKLTSLFTKAKISFTFIVKKLNYMKLKIWNFVLTRPRLTRGRLGLDSGDSAESGPSQVNQCKKSERGTVSERCLPFRFRLGRVGTGTADSLIHAVNTAQGHKKRNENLWVFWICNKLYYYGKIKLRSKVIRTCCANFLTCLTFQ